MQFQKTKEACPCTESGFTRTDVQMMLLALFTLAGVCFPLLAGNLARDQRLVCANNLHLMGQALSSFALDHGNSFPWRVGRPEGGSAGVGVVANHWMTLSNYLQSPGLTTCPASRRTPAGSFAGLRNANTSYVVGSDCDPSLPGCLLSADRDIEGGTPSACSYVGGATVQSFDGQFGIPVTYTAKWSATNHVGRGNLLTGDGSVSQADTTGLKWVMARTTDAGNNNHSLIP